MSKKHNSSKSKTLYIISIAIIFYMLAFSLVFINVSDDRSLAASDVWEHIKTICLIVVGYWFGSARNG
jgi:hypothetical protein